MKAKRQALIWEYVESFAIAISLALIVRTFVIQPFKIPSGSMRPTLIEGDRILVNKYLYRFRDPEPGEVIVFQATVSSDSSKKDYIKRLAAVGGQNVEIREGRIWIDNSALTQPGIFRDNFYYNRGEYGEEGKTVRVPDGEYFVLGDNSGSSLDSRFWGYVPQKNIIGRAFFIFWPPHRMRTLR